MPTGTLHILGSELQKRRRAKRSREEYRGGEKGLLKQDSNQGERVSTKANVICSSVKGRRRGPRPEKSWQFETRLGLSDRGGGYLQINTFETGKGGAGGFLNP